MGFEWDPEECYTRFVVHQSAYHIHARRQLRRRQEEEEGQELHPRRGLLDERLAHPSLTSTFFLSSHSPRDVSSSSSSRYMGFWTRTRVAGIYSIDTGRASAFCCECITVGNGVCPLFFLRARGLSSTVSSFSAADGYIVGTTCGFCLLVGKLAE
jgi:hypothetical protein